MATSTFNLTTFASNNAAGTAVWSNPSQASASDGSYARAISVAAGAETEYLDCRTLVSPTVTGTVIGVKVEVEERADAAGVFKAVEIKLIKAGSIVGTSRHDSFNTGANATYATTSDTYRIYGAIVDMWGTTLTAAQVNAADFGVAIRYKNHDGALARTLFVDHVRVTIYTSETAIAYSTGFASGTLAADFRQMVDFGATGSSASDATGECVFTTTDTSEFPAAYFAKPEDTTRVFNGDGAAGVFVRLRCKAFSGATEGVALGVLGSPKAHLPQLYLTANAGVAGNAAFRFKHWDGTGAAPTTIATIIGPAIQAGDEIAVAVIDGAYRVYHASSTASDSLALIAQGTSNLVRMRGLVWVSGRHQGDNSSVDDLNDMPIGSFAEPPFEGVRGMVFAAGQTRGIVTGT